MKWHFILISFLVGFLSLGEEIVWVRIVGFMGHSVPQAFTFVLFCYIGGIAIGAFLGPRLVKARYLPLSIIGFLLIFSGTSVFVSPWIIQYLYSSVFVIVAIAMLIIMGAALKGAIFPLVHHWFSQPGKKLGRSLSFVYFANVMGSALGPLLVGFYLLDKFSMFMSIDLLAVSELVLGSIILYLSAQPLTFILPLCVLIGSSILIKKSENVLPSMLANSFSYEGKVTNIIENRHGVIYTHQGQNATIESVYGGNVYDGGFNIDLVKNSNGIDRAFLLAALRPQPKKVLVIGLSSGSWLRVIAAIPGTKEIDVVEINPGYEKLVRKYPGAQDLFNDERIKIIYTDGRQLVQRKIMAGQKYDLIVMNSTWHWRAYSTNLLSAEFMRMLKQIMNNGAVAAFNTTDSFDVAYTASTIFSNAYKFKNFMYVSDHDLRQELVENTSKLCELNSIRIDNQSCKQPEYVFAINRLAEGNLLEWNDIQKEKIMKRKPEIVTDNNMIIEYKYGIGFFL